MGYPLPLILLFLVGFIVLVVVLSGLSAKCTACKKWWDIKEFERHETHREPGVKTVKRTEVRKDADGKVLDQIERDEQVPVARITYQVLRRCKHCGHEDRQILVEERESGPVGGAARGQANLRCWRVISGRSGATCAAAAADTRTTSAPVAAVRGKCSWRNRRAAARAAPAGERSSSPSVPPVTAPAGPTQSGPEEAFRG